MKEVNRYRHFCPMAQAMERLGERWGMLIVRDLLPGEQRFTELLGSCGGITPRQLATRLRQLEGDGIVQARREPGRRAVWYRLTPAGQALKPVVEAMLLWGVRHITRPPGPDEPVLTYQLINGTRLALAAARGQPRGPVRWTWRFSEEPYTLSYDGTEWSLAAGDSTDADVVIETTPRDWAEFVARRDAPRADLPVRVRGRPARVREFTAVFPSLSRAT
jgi:DNA-binding HxlR family transcriptional regulator